MKFIEFIDGPTGEVISRRPWHEVPEELRTVGDTPIARVFRWPGQVEEYAEDGQLLRTHTLK